MDQEVKKRQDKTGMLGKSLKGPGTRSLHEREITGEMK